MERSPSLTPRQQSLLFAVCRDYILTGEPSSSGRLVKMHGFPWSSATVRQEFAVLERDGLLQRSHHSSARCPTRVGLEHYVASLSEGTRLSPQLATVLDRGLAAAGHSVGDEVRVASQVLSEVAGCVAVSFVGSARGGRIETVDVAPLVLPRALVVLGFGDGATVMRTVSVESLDEDPDDPGAADRQVRTLQSKLRALCSGRTLDEALTQLRAQQQAGQARVDRALAEALRLGLIVCAGASLDPLWLQVSGQGTLAVEAVTSDGLGELLGLLEDYQRLAEVLCQLVPASPEGRLGSESGRAQVRVGVPLGRSALGRPDGPAHPVRVSVVGCRLPIPRLPTPERSDGAAQQDSAAAGHSETGIVALLGFERMDYARAIPLVEYAARSLAALGDSGEPESGPAA